MSNKGLKQASIRAVTSTTGTYEEDWHALFDLAGIATGTFNGRLLGYINHKLSSSYDNLPSAMQAFAADNGAYNWDSLGTFDASEGDGSLADVIASAVFDLDATQAASYTSGVTWSNLVTAPADGSAQTAYDFYTGDGSTSTTYPTFNGSAGDAAAYWSFDGGDYFGLKSGTNTTLINNLSKTTGGSDFWFAVAVKHIDGPSTIGIINTQATANGAGVSVRFQAGEIIDLTQRQTANSIGSSVVTATNDTNYLIIASHSHSNNTTRFWINSTTVIEIAHTFNTGTSNASIAMVLGTLGAGRFASGTFMYSAAMGNEYLDDTKAAAIITALEARHARDYTP